jgi:phage terminase large subunit-like protein
MELQLRLAKVKLKLIKELKNDYYKFFKYFWDVIQVDDFVDNWSIEYICYELEKVGKQLIKREKKFYDLIINLPVGESKSSMSSQAFHAWLWANDPKLTIICASGGDSLVTKNAERARNLIESDKFKDLFGSEAVQIKKKENKIKYYTNTKGGTRISMSLGSKIIGEHAHIHIYDDPIDTEGVISKAIVEQTNRHLTGKLATRFTDKRIAPRVLMMQRLAVGDPTDLLKEKSLRVKQISLPAKLTKDTEVLPKGSLFKGKPVESYYQNGLLNPVRKDQDALDQYLADLGPVQYAAQLQMAPKPKEGIIIKQKSIIIKKIWELPTGIWDSYYKYWADTSYTTKESNDPNGLLKTKTHDGILYVFDYKGFREEAGDAIDTFADYMDQDEQIGPIYVENKASGLTYAQLLRKAGYNAIDFKHDGRDKESRLRYVSQFFKSARVIFVDGDYVEGFTDVLKSFPKVSHDEEVDVICMAALQELDRTFRREIA